MFKHLIKFKQLKKKKENFLVDLEEKRNRKS